MAKDLAIVLNNGSVNSAVATALAAQKYRPVMLYAEITPQAGSRARAAYDLQVAHFKPYREHSLPMPFLASVGKDNSAAVVADPRRGAAIGRQVLELLPIVSTAVKYAVHYQATAVFLGLRVGAGADELAQATEYVQVWNEMVQLPCGQGEIEIVAPLLDMEAWQVVDLAFQVAAPLDRTWSCVEEMSDPCWACRGCRGREAAFVQAAKADPMRVVRKV